MQRRIIRLYMARQQHTTNYTMSLAATYYSLRAENEACNTCVRVSATTAASKLGMGFGII